MLNKSWINSHNSGVFTTFINGEYQNTTDQNSFFQVKNPFNGLKSYNQILFK